MYRAVLEHKSRHKIWDENNVPIGYVYKDKQGEWVLDAEEVRLTFTELRNLIAFVSEINCES